MYLLVLCEIRVQGPKEWRLPYDCGGFLPPGLTVINNFITAAEEEQLLAVLDWTDTETGK